ncbi:MAG: phage tail tube protein [Planctomycetota bacterium]
MAENVTTGLCVFAYANQAADSGATYTDLTQVVDLTPPGLEADDVDITNMSHADRVKRFIAGFVDPGRIEFVAQYTKAEYAALLALVGVSRAYRITLNDASTIVIESSYLKGIQPPVEREGIVTMTLTIKVSGPVTFTPSA